MHIFLTNDDGIHAHGLRHLYAAIIKAGHTADVVAPITEQSAVSNSITFATPLRTKKIEEADFKGFAVYGTPVDCAKLGLSSLTTQKPDLVLSGINRGVNAGPDIMYSGTVAAATEGALMGHKSIAISFDSYSAIDFKEQAEHVVALLPQIPWETLPPRCVLNLNYPNCPIKETQGIKFCPQSKALWHDWYEERTSPRGEHYWWVDGVVPPESIEVMSDRGLIREGYITLTPLHFDFTDYDTLKKLEGMKL